MEYLRTLKCQCGVGLIIAASLVSRKFGSVIVGNMLEQPGKARFLRTDFSVATADGRHFCFCTRKLAACRQPGAK